jgi:hypothetical protein
MVAPPRIRNPARKAILSMAAFPCLLLSVRVSRSAVGGQEDQIAFAVPPRATRAGADRAPGGNLCPNLCPRRGRASRPRPARTSRPRKPRAGLAMAFVVVAPLRRSSSVRTWARWPFLGRGVFAWSRLVNAVGTLWRACLNNCRDCGGRCWATFPMGNRLKARVDTCDEGAGTRLVRAAPQRWPCGHIIGGLPPGIAQDI